MKKDALKKNLKLQLHRETLRALEDPQLLGVAAGATVGSCPYTCKPCTTYTMYC
jgi:hypothetical protein